MKIILISISLLLFSNPLDVVRREHVLSIEHNRVYSANEETPRLDQLIFWDIHPDFGVKECRGWVRSDRALVIGTQVIIVDSEAIRIIRGEHIYDTWTLYDPEIENRAIIPVESRRLVTGRR